jgi:DNA (cytosine-5)-methyltransferase 1
MRFIELFAGIGGFRLGLEKADKNKRWLQEQGNGGLSKHPCWEGFQCVWANDNDKYACQIYRNVFSQSNTDIKDTQNWREGKSHQETQLRCDNNGNWHEPSRLYEGDIRTVDVDSIPEHDLLCGGFPCQSFSIAGKRRGFEDTRGTLFFEICRILRSKRTKYVFLENVKGLLSHDNGTTFQTIIGTLDELGYDCQWQVLNSKNHGVPQNRERVFIIGHLRGQSRPKVFPIGEDGEWFNEWSDEATSVRSLCGGGHSGGHHSGMTLLQAAYPGGIREYTSVRPAVTCGQLPMVAQALQTDGQLRSGTSWGTNNPQSKRNIRRLTPVECERLQGFPDNWTKNGLTKDGKEVEISDTQRYKTLGNAVSVPVITAIGEQLWEGLC